ncbi:hypothetical protein G7Y89_g15053 [Cudoniella acicularis]|uniref:Lysine-specific metallo-endopeptidase domain-containing protein n=1 Tax=Cudoniella acicularis TaxID=354080 RepID=A0A8H4VPD4_9HELO|nr:hypothetical protein G7Y89_g15053 [Cudoniella acicularis]
MSHFIVKFGLFLAFSWTALAIDSQYVSGSSSDERSPIDLRNPPNPPLGPLPNLQAIFDISQDVPNGGCSPQQISILETAFKACIANVEQQLLPAIAQMRAGTDSAATGWMFSYLFAISGSAKRGPNVPLSSNDEGSLGLLENTLNAILQHSRGILKFGIGNNPAVVKTRLYCSPSWLKFQDIYFPDPGNPTQPHYLMSQKWKDAQGNSNEIGLYFDAVSGIYAETEARRSAPDPNFPLDLASCGVNGFGITGVRMNAVMICPLSWGGQYNSGQNIYNFGARLPATTSEVTIAQDITYIDDLRSIAQTLLHEYLHVVARGQDGILDVSGPEIYGYPDCVNVANGPSGSTDEALGNPDNFAILGSALLKSTYDWRDGYARNPSFWAARQPSTPLTARPPPSR